MYKNWCIRIDFSFLYILRDFLKVLLERFKSRVNSLERHIGNQNGQNFSEWENILTKWTIEKISIEAEFLDVDTTDFKSLDYEKIFSYLEDML